MEYVNFEIEGIQAGWFDMTYNIGKEKVTISASDAYGNDSPKYFLQMLCDLLTNKIHTGYVLFDEEPGVYIVCMEKQKEYQLSLFFSEVEDICKKLQVYGQLSTKEIREQFLELEEMAVVKELSLTAFAKTVVRSFEEYSFYEGKKVYEENWMEFPKEEFLQLQNCLQKQYVEEYNEE